MRLMQFICGFGVLPKCIKAGAVVLYIEHYIDNYIISYAMLNDEIEHNSTFSISTIQIIFLNIL